MGFQIQIQNIDGCFTYSKHYADNKKENVIEDAKQIKINISDSEVIIYKTKSKRPISVFMVVI